MKVRRIRLLTSILALASSPAFACLSPPTSPEEQFRSHSHIVLAHPIAIATSPPEAISADFDGKLSQTIQWQVLISWKGSYKLGDVLTTMEDLRTSSCGNGAQYTREAMLLYLDGTEPYRRPVKARPVDSIDDLKYLERKTPGG